MAVGRKSKKSTQRPWRPDFRDAQSLPDTKVIRTGFLLNFIAIALAMMILTLYVVREYSLQSLKRSVSALELQVADSTAQNRIILDSNKRFRENASVVEEVIAFDHQMLDMTGFIRSMSGLVPNGIVLSFVQLSHSDETTGKNKIPPFVIDLSGRISGDTGATPSQIINAFQRTIGELPILENREVDMDLTRFNRNNEFGYFDFTLQVRIMAPSGSES